MPTIPHQFGDWLFDASRNYALPFRTAAEKIDSLNLCVRTNDYDEHVTYDGIVLIKGRMPGVRIIPSDKLLGKRRPPPTSQPEQPKRPCVR